MDECWTNIYSYSLMIKTLKTPDELRQLDHAKVLIQLIEEVRSNFQFDITVIDIGCGTAQFRPFFNKDKYFGLDHESVIDNVTLKCFPDFNPSNLIKSSIHFTSNLIYLGMFDLVLMNAFIDVMSSPIEMFENILKNCTNYVIIHRQEISEDKNTQVSIERSYGMQTYHSIINKKDFDQVIKKCNFEIITSKKLNFSNWENGGSSFILKRKL